MTLQAPWLAVGASVIVGVGLRRVAVAVGVVVGVLGSSVGVAVVVALAVGAATAVCVAAVRASIWADRRAFSVARAAMVATA
jgi:hypothetical protein